ncbi:MAG TPA: substrate-binding domain-containing protein [Methanocorpusculum sp.]|nr:substrate-binding domain-containing protein [Methanocorpusculum sp.]
MKVTKIAAVSALILCVILAIASAGCTGNAAQNVEGDLDVIADTKLTAPMTDIIMAFEKKYTKVNTTISYGNSNEIASQMIAGTITPDNFVSTDEASIKSVEKANLSLHYAATTLPYNVMIDSGETVTGALFLSFMEGADGKAIFKSHGYTTST